MIMSEGFREERPQHAERVYVLLVSAFVGVLLITNVITAKYFRLGHIVLTAGALTYPFTFSLLDIISELYDKKRAVLAIWMGLIVSIFMTAVIQLASFTPAYAYSPVSQEVFQLVFGFTPGIVVGSMVAYLTAQFTDIYLFDWGRKLTRGKHLWLRNNVSTLLGQLVDTLLFGLIAWIAWPLLGWSTSLTPLSWSAWYQLMVNEYTFKVVFTLLNTPLVYLGVYVIRRWIG